ncbi:MAG: isopentenyl phosphate kinase family protein [Thermoplasmata archaeon]|nr:isopentenyl phosphate kinase family protein [Thermoplasmata archaeon]
MEPAVATLTVVKLGGSILTRKREEGKLRPKILSRLATELGTARSPLLLLHGAGSFGHVAAKRTGLAEAPTAGQTPAQRRRAAVAIAAQVRTLHQAVLRAAVAAGVPAFSLPVGGVAKNRSGELAELDPAPFREALDAGLVPVSFGDVVRDERWGFSILSADSIALRLAPALGARRVVFVSDVPGVLEAPAPTQGPPRVIPRVTAATLDHLLPRPGAPDVTGGIRGKLKVLLALAEAGVDAGIISGLRHGALSRALAGEVVYGSWAGPSYR